MDEADKDTGRFRGGAFTEADWAEHIAELKDTVALAKSSLTIIPVQTTAAAAASVIRDPVTKELIPQVVGTVYERLTAPSTEQAETGDVVDDQSNAQSNSSEADERSIASTDLDVGVASGDDVEEPDRTTAAAQDLDSKVFVELRRLLIETDVFRTGFASKQQVRFHGL